MLLKIITLLAIVDYILTVIWTYRWNSSPYVKEFKHKIPFKLIEANPIIRYFVNSGKNHNLYITLTFGYAVVYLIQLGLLALSPILGFLVTAVLIGAIISHTLNNKKTSNKHIIKMTMEYNKEINKKRKKDGGN